MARPRIATYRVQLTPSFGFDAAAAVVPDVARLGASHLYLSPVAEAVEGSTHGYDVVDPARVRTELGGPEGLRRLAVTARDHDVGLVIDIVPNHVSTAVPQRNGWWWALLRDGRDGPTAELFDVDWEPTGGRVVLPVLGGPLADVIAAGELRRDGDRLCYHDRAFPLRPGTDDVDVARLAEQQRYLLQNWREPRRNVRRFFTIDDLVAIRPEVPEVAEAVHATTAALVADGLLDGVRVDHVDGLADPPAYLRDLRSVVGDDSWLLVEKILVGDERLPDDWAADGTTGYEWITLVDHVFTHPAGEEVMTASWRTHTGDPLDYHEHEIAGVRDVLDGALRPDLERVARTAARELDERGRGVDDPTALEAPLVALTTHLGRYRTYLTATDAHDAALVRTVASRAADDLDGRGRQVLDALLEVILDGTETTRRWQQLTGPALAKGGEDRALYRYLRLAAHNEVGGDPGSWSRPVEAFHDHNRLVAATRPSTLLAASTHDTKRSEDVRARLLVLTEMPELWASTTAAWRAVASGAVDVGAIGGPLLLLAFQTAVGAWPIDRERLGAYLVKASREAGARTTWADPFAHHERRLAALAAVLTDGELAAPVGELVTEIASAGNDVSLAQLVLRLTAPGVPDLYQGSETWLRTLVDPDNRSPLDAAGLRLAIEGAETDGAVWAAEAPKTALIARTLAARRRNAANYGPGARYEALPATGRYADHVVAFVRRPPPEQGDRPITTVAARFPRSRPDGWGDTAIDVPDGPAHDVLGAGEAPVRRRTHLADLLGPHPAALLM
jgi:(1->4)-alpha-D-glucan 1-alpha-D-glucosylmutase